MVVDSWSRRADLVLANGKLSAFEIKSDFDTLTRLAGQLETYRAVFERVVVVVTPKFQHKLDEIVPEGIGIWIVDDAVSGGIREKRRARTIELSREAAIALMTVTDLRRLLYANGISGAAKTCRRELEALAGNLTKKDLASAARNSVKRRFRSHFRRFVSRRESRGTYAALRALNRTQRQKAQPQEELPIAVPNVEIPADHPLVIATPVGPMLRRAIRGHSSSSSSPPAAGDT